METLYLAPGFDIRSIRADAACIQFLDRCEAAFDKLRVLWSVRGSTKIGQVADSGLQHIAASVADRCHSSAPLLTRLTASPYCFTLHCRYGTIDANAVPTLVPDSANPGMHIQDKPIKIKVPCRLVWCHIVLYHPLCLCRLGELGCSSSMLFVTPVSCRLLQGSTFVTRWLG